MTSLRSLRDFQWSRSIWRRKISHLVSLSFKAVKTSNTRCTCKDIKRNAIITGDLKTSEELDLQKEVSKVLILEAFSGEKEDVESHKYWPILMLGLMRASGLMLVLQVAQSSLMQLTILRDGRTVFIFSILLHRDSSPT